MPTTSHFTESPNEASVPEAPTTEDALRRTEEAIQAALTEVQESRARFRAASKEQMQAQRQQLNESAAEKSEGQR